MPVRPLVNKTTPPGIPSSIWRSGRVLIFGYDLFLSHAHFDGREYAAALWPRLEELGLTVCFDRADFHIGERLHFTMRRTVVSSRALLLLDTPKARESVEVKREIEDALAKSKPLLLIRREDLHDIAWPLVDANDSPIWEGDSTERFSTGDPSGAAIERINSSHKARRVRTEFRMFASAVAIMLIGLGTWSMLNRLFASRVAAIDAQIHDADVSIHQLDESFDALAGSWILGAFGRAFQLPEMQLLDSELSRIQLKPINWQMTEMLARARLPPNTFRTSSSYTETVAIVPSRASLFVIRDDALWLIEAQTSESTRCHATEGSPVSVAVDRDGQRVALLTTSGLFLWDDGRCQSPPASVASSARRQPDEGLLRMTFGNHAQSLLLATPSRVTTFDCQVGSPCRDAVTHTVADATRSGQATVVGQGVTIELQFCEAIISPTSALVVVSVGACRLRQRRDVCAFAEVMRCEEFTDRTQLSFHPSGNSVVATEPWLSRWDVGGMAPSREARPPRHKVLWRFEKDFRSLAGIGRLTFSSNGSRLLIAKSEQGSILSLYQWPDVRLLQAVSLNAEPEYLYAGSRVLLGKGSEATAFDFRQ